MKHYFYFILSTIFAFLLVVFFSIHVFTSNHNATSVDTHTRSTSNNFGEDRGDITPVTEISKEHMYAFVVGVDTYDDDNIPKLECCVSDAKSLAEKFKALGFPEKNITLLVDSVTAKQRPSKENIENKLQELTSQLPENSLIIFSFAGHGAELTGKGTCFLPTDTDTAQLDSTVVYTRDVSNWLEKSKAQVKLMLVDTCREVITRNTRNLRSFNKVEAPKGLAVLQSCSYGEFAREDRTNHHGYFTLAFLEALDGKADTNNDGVVTLNEVFSYTSKHTETRVQKDCSATQRPFYSFNGATIQDFPFVTGLLVDGLTKEQRDEAEGYYIEADKAFTNGDYKLAQKKINKAVEIYGKNAKYKKLRNTIDKMVKALDAQKKAETEQQRLTEEKQTAEQKAQAEAEARKRAEEQARLAEQKPTTPTVTPSTTVPTPSSSSEEHQAGDRLVKTVRSVKLAFRWCPAGTFMMGSPESEEGRDNDETQHQVTLTKGFWMLETEVTQKQWKAIMGTNPSKFKGDDLPVETVSWNDCQEFCKECTLLGLPVCLPTEAQWEYACRAGTTGPYAGNLDDMAWYGFHSNPKGTCNDEATTRSVGTKKANAWNLYDMHGNVSEWCADWKDDYPSDSVTDPFGPSSGLYRVSRGGSWLHYARYCRSAVCDEHTPEFSKNDIGFRVVLKVEQKAESRKKFEQKAESEAEARKKAEEERQRLAEEKRAAEQKAQAEAEARKKAEEERQRLVEKKHQAGDRMVKTVKGVEFAFRWCPAGTFMMGSPKSEKGRGSDETQHRVTLTKGFWMMEKEVTQRQWKAIMETNPSHFIGEDLPVETVSWEDCQEFCEKCSELGLPMCLPTEAQWEYACRARTTGSYAGNLDDMAWYGGDYRDSKAHAVGTKSANAWGLYDMHGNVGEWCADWYAKKHYGNDATDPVGPSDGSSHVCRGGSWYGSAQSCRSAIRRSYSPKLRNYYLGCRVVLNGQFDEQTSSEAEVSVPAVIEPIADGEKAGDRMVKTVNGVEFAFRWCPAGTFLMGSPESEEGRNNDETQHKVILTNGFWMMETEITQKQWKVVMGTTIEQQRDKGNTEWPLYSEGDNYPMYYITKEECQEFSKKCTKLGLPVCLPTEAQWEYACRAGKTEPYAGDLDAMAWYEDNSDETTHPVGTKSANAWGLYDMHGNVREWCEDGYTKEHYGEDATDPVGSSDSSSCIGSGAGWLVIAGDVVRGGSWKNHARVCRSAHRGSHSPMHCDGNLGFRVVIKTEQKARAEAEARKKAEEQARLAKQKTTTPKGSKAGDHMIKTVCGVKFVFRWCPAGTFTMGSPLSEKGSYNNEREYDVTLTKGFWMLETEVSQKQWKAVMGTNPSCFKGDDLPVENVSWDDCQAFCEKCAGLGLLVCLPTAAQWEYACRAGTTGPYAGKLDKMAWYLDNSSSKTHSVDTKKNAWGIYNMHGNVREWCIDWEWNTDWSEHKGEGVPDEYDANPYEDYRYESAYSHIYNPFGPSSGSRRVVRGGSWNCRAQYCRSAFRNSYPPKDHLNDLGFRVVLKGQ